MICIGAKIGLVLLRFYTAHKFRNNSLPALYNSYNFPYPTAVKIPLKIPGPASDPDHDQLIVRCWSHIPPS